MATISGDPDTVTGQERGTDSGRIDASAVTQRRDGDLHRIRGRDADPRRKWRPKQLTLTGQDDFVDARANPDFDLGSGNDTLFDSFGAGNIQGGAGNDWIASGCAANDTLAGGPGNARLIGGTGANSFVLATSGGADLVGDFDMTLIDGRTVDQLDVSGLRVPMTTPSKPAMSWSA